MKIIHEREKCIGCGSCAALCSKYWEMGEDNKSNLKGGKPAAENGVFELELGGNNPECNQEAKNSCPVECIHIK